MYTKYILLLFILNTKGYVDIVVFRVLFLIILGLLFT
jgi:hypothetical protein